MNTLCNVKFGDYLSANAYPGRTIITGVTPSKKAACAYFIMGRSENSRNRVFKEEGENVVIYPYDAAKVTDPSLIIYSPLRICGNNLIVTNGNQTDTVYDAITLGGSFESALDTREFEPDVPNYTPRISGIIDTKTLRYKLSILKCGDGIGGVCNRFCYSYSPLPGFGHIIHTYESDGNPLPSFTGEPRRIEIPDCIDAFTSNIWDNLNENNRISLYVRFIDPETGKAESRLINKNI